MRIKIEVKKSHIAKGEASNPYACPVALAMRAKFKRYFYVFEDGIGCGENITDEVSCPVIVQDFMKLFDDGKPCKPFSFTLRRIPESTV